MKLLQPIYLVTACSLLVVTACSTQSTTSKRAPAVPTVQQPAPVTQPQVQTQTQNATVATTVTANDISMAYPVIFHHGILDSSARTSFAGLEAALEARSVDVHLTEVAAANSIAFRAEQLAEQVDDIISTTGATKVNIVAHSMGGLDARYLISTLGYADRVASLSTIATPHRGTAVADLVMDYSDDVNLDSDEEDRLNSILGVFTSFLGTDDSSDDADIFAAIEDITEEYMEDEFNPANPNADDVYYQSWAGESGFGTGDTLRATLWATWAYLIVSDGRNDGLVPDNSAEWGEYQGLVAADHIDLSGRENTTNDPDQFDHVTFYSELVEGLAALGY